MLINLTVKDFKIYFFLLILVFIMKVLKIISLIVIGFSLYSCKDDSISNDGELIAGTTIESNGLTKDINDIIPEEYIENLEKNNFQIHRGINPPSLENSYFCSPLYLVYSNVIGDGSDYRFSDLDVTFFGQNNEKLTINQIYKGGVSVGLGSGGFLVGENNYFTSFFLTNVTFRENYEIISAMVYSGKLNSNGIEDLQFAVIMIDDAGDPYNELIEEGDFRIIEDEDGFSEIVTDQSSNNAFNNNLFSKILRSKISSETSP